MIVCSLESGPHLDLQRFQTDEGCPRGGWELRVNNGPGNADNQSDQGASVALEEIQQLETPRIKSIPVPSLSSTGSTTETNAEHSLCVISKLPLDWEFRLPLKSSLLMQSHLVACIK